MRSAEPTWPTILSDLVQDHHLSAPVAAWAMREIVRGNVAPARVAGFVTALRAKGESAVELSAFVDALLDSAVRVNVPSAAVDIAGTGGDGTGAVNVSTMAAIIAAAAGVIVVKHGGRSASSTTGGAADLIEHLGVNLDLTPAQAESVIAEAGLVFLFAPKFNPALRHVVDVRRELGIPTVFNVLAPLINPADPRQRVVGVADVRKAPVLADVLASRGRSGLVVRGRDGLDKITTVTTSDVWIVRDGTVTSTVLDPCDLDLPRAGPADLRGGTAAESARIVHSLLDGEPGPVRDLVLLNAAAVLVAAGSVEGHLVDQLRDGIRRGADAIDSGAARATLARLVQASWRG